MLVSDTCTNPVRLRSESEAGWAASLGKRLRSESEAGWAASLRKRGRAASLGKRGRLGGFAGRQCFFAKTMQRKLRQQYRLVDMVESTQSARIRTAVAR